MFPHRAQDSITNCYQTHYLNRLIHPVFILYCAYVLFFLLTKYENIYTVLIKLLFIVFCGFNNIYFWLLKTRLLALFPLKLILLNLFLLILRIFFQSCPLTAGCLSLFRCLVRKYFIFLSSFTRANKFHALSS